jgi:hypothetical protein
VEQIAMPFMRLSEKQRTALELEVVPHQARLELTRIIRDACAVEDEDEVEIVLIHENEFINIANQVLGRPIYLLKGGDWGEFHPAEYAWHHGQRELIMRIPSTPELAEILADYLEKGMMRRKDVNEILSNYGCGFTFERDGYRSHAPVEIQVVPVDSIDEVDLKTDHPNVRRLVTRMDAALKGHDFSGVLHASASIFETLAKDVMKNPNVNDQTLASFFEGYKKKSLLPEPILDYMLNVYQQRNSQPLAGHGSLTEPNINPENAVALCELTKTIVRIERKLIEQAISPTALTVPTAKPPSPKASKAKPDSPSKHP